MNILTFKKLPTFISTALLAILFILVLSTSALAGTYSWGLDFSIYNGDENGDGYTWDNETNTLTIDEEGFTLISETEGITFPEDTTLILNGDLVIESSDYALGSYGGLYITGEGSLILLSSNSTAIISLGSIVFDEVEAYVVGYSAALYATGDMYFTDANITLLGYTYSSAEEDIYINNSKISSNTYLLAGDISVDEASEINAVLSLNLINEAGNDYYEDYIFGTVIVMPEGLGYGVKAFYKGELYLTADSILIIRSGAVADLSNYSIIAEAGSIFIESGGELILPEGLSIADLEALGVVIVDNYVVDDASGDIFDTDEGTSPEVDIETKEFSDVLPEYWFYNDVMTAYNNGWIAGMSETEFSPNTATSRAMVTTILYRMSAASVEVEENQFSDVVADSWYEAGVVWAAELGIVSGYGDGIFAPNDNITREQLAVILYNYALSLGIDVELSGVMGMAGYVDIGEISSWAVPAMTWAVLSGIFTGSGDELNPTDAATRAELAVVLNKFAALL